MKTKRSADRYLTQFHFKNYTIPKSNYGFIFVGSALTIAFTPYLLILAFFMLGMPACSNHEPMKNPAPAVAVEIPAETNDQKAEALPDIEKAVDTVFENAEAIEKAVDIVVKKTSDKVKYDFLGRPYTDVGGTVLYDVPFDVSAYNIVRGSIYLFPSTEIRGLSFKAVMSRIPDKSAIERLSSIIFQLEDETGTSLITRRVPFYDDKEARNAIHISDLPTGVTTVRMSAKPAFRNVFNGSVHSPTGYYGLISYSKLYIITVENNTVTVRSKN